MAKVWGIHMPEWVGDDPIEKGFVVLGWSRLGDIFVIPNDREEFKRRLAAAYPEKKPGAIPVDAGTLLRFAHEIATGELIVYPSKHNRMVNIGRATGKRWHGPALNPGDDAFPNFLGVNWLGSYPRNDFSQAALNEIGSFITLFRVRQHASEFEAKVGGAQTPSFENEEEPLIPDDVASQTASQLAEENTQDFVIRRINAGLTGFEFEQFTAHLMECLGYTARVTEKSGDGGVDIIAHTDQLGFQPPIIKIQCKHKRRRLASRKSASFSAHSERGSLPCS